MKKYFISSLGCPKNLVDSERFGYILHSSGYENTDNVSDADLILVNTCGFIEEAVEEAVNTILQIHALRKDSSVLIATGCMTERFFSYLKEELNEVNHIIRLKDFKGFQKIINSENIPFLSRRLLTKKHYAYLRISDGCNNFCSYCVIPSIRGSLKSESIDSLIEECYQLAEFGVKELIITAQDITQYGKDIYGKSNLINLLEKIVAIDKFTWIRLLYLHPASISNDLLFFIKNNPSVCKYLDIPLQHINDRMLRKMNRHITKKRIIELISNIRDILPEIKIRTTFISGFPGETYKHYKELKDFIKETEFDKLGVFCYSDEYPSPASKMRNKVSKKAMIQRRKVLMDIQQQISTNKLEKMVGKTLKVIIDEKLQENEFCYEGRTEADAPEIDGVVFITKGQAKPGDIVDVKITDSWEFDLVGEIV